MNVQRERSGTPYGTTLHSGSFGLIPSGGLYKDLASLSQLPSRIKVPPIVKHNEERTKVKCSIFFFKPTAKDISPKHSLSNSIICTTLTPFHLCKNRRLSGALSPFYSRKSKQRS